MLKPYGLKVTEGAELVRVALREHRTPVTRVVAVALRMLKRLQPSMRLIVSYADPAYGHHGGIYQGGGWIYTGITNPDWALIDPTGRRWHSRMVSTTGRKRVYGKERRVLKPTDGTKVVLPGKHRYLMPLDGAMRQQVRALAKPYPKRHRSIESDASGLQPGTRALQCDPVAPTGELATHAN